MNKRIKIGIDFDKVFVSYPPIIPSSLIEYLYKKRNHKLSYRIPGKIEQTIRILSHMPALRMPIKHNIVSLKKLANKNRYDIYLVSSRFSFLESRTMDWDKKHKVFKFFKKIYFNFNDEQPHLFKDKIIKSEKVENFIDDDLDLLLYLSKNNSKVNFFWVTNNGFSNLSLPKNISKIKTLEEFRIKLK